MGQQQMPMGQQQMPMGQQQTGNQMRPQMGNQMRSQMGNQMGNQMRQGQYSQQQMHQQPMGQMNLMGQSMGQAPIKQQTGMMNQQQMPQMMNQSVRNQRMPMQGMNMSQQGMNQNQSPMGMGQQPMGHSMPMGNQGTGMFQVSANVNSGLSQSKLDTIKRLAAQLEQVKALQAKLQAIAQKKAAQGGTKSSVNEDAMRRQNAMIEKLSKHIQQLRQSGNAPQPLPSNQGPVPPVKMPAKDDQQRMPPNQQNTGLFSIPPNKWNVEQVLQWLAGAGFGAHRESFARRNVDGTRLMSLTHQDLSGPLAVGDQKKVERLHTAIRSLMPRVQTEIGQKRKMDSRGSAPRSSSSRTQPRPKRSRKRFAWIATIESWVLEHEMHCNAYHPGEKQTLGPEPGICCSNLKNGAQYDLRVVANSNKCCGVSDLIVLCNAETKKVVGSLPCSMTQFLAPLMQEDLIVITGATTQVIHPEGGVPPFELAVEGDLMRLAGLKRDARFRMHIRKLQCLLDNWEGDW
eukprot:CAMPEP_0184480892 /NCGR_PEP_ID=MMETSP0113_2-20130426/2410_1 /TAXON_ID=91329 /ORGANISM="Norrisiella sphaerica, Strain BC52" /LENGTH=512 /DNA_ID=CAMNT_0026859679 /DNA_START=1 /DNA_END=1536 /DNA_ORIENTATION=+